MTSVSAGHIILTPIQPVGSERPQRESNPGPFTRSRAVYRLSYCPPPPPPPPTDEEVRKTHIERDGTKRDREGAEREEGEGRRRLIRWKMSRERERRQRKRDRYIERGVGN